MERSKTRDNHPKVKSMVYFFKCHPPKRRRPQNKERCLQSIHSCCWYKKFDVILVHCVVSRVYNHNKVEIYLGYNGDVLGNSTWQIVNFQ
jgi:hypothetical protein